MLSGLGIYSILPSIMAFHDKLLIYKDIVTIWFLSTILNFVDTKAHIVESLQNHLGLTRKKSV